MKLCQVSSFCLDLTHFSIDSVSGLIGYDYMVAYPFPDMGETTEKGPHRYGNETQMILLQSREGLPASIHIFIIIQWIVPLHGAL